MIKAVMRWLTWFFSFRWLLASMQSDSGEGSNDTVQAAQHSDDSAPSTSRKLRTGTMLHPAARRPRQRRRRRAQGNTQVQQTEEPPPELEPPPGFRRIRHPFVERLTEGSSPGITIWSYGQYQAGLPGANDRLEAAVEELNEVPIEQASLQRSKAAFDLMTAPQYRFQRAHGDNDQSLVLARRLLVQLEADRLAVGDERTHFSVITKDGEQLTDPEEVIQALESGNYSQTAQLNGHFASCEVCIRPGSPHPTIAGHNDRVMVITRRAEFTAPTANYMEHLAAFIDPRSWANCTGANAPAGAPSAASGWGHSIPVNTTATPDELVKVDLFAHPVTATLGTKWDHLFYEEVTNLALRSWRILLGIEFKPNLPDELVVTHEFVKQLGGPNRAEMTRDDGHLRITHDSGRIYIEMVKELNFVDYGVYAHDMIEYQLPFIACGWFDDIYTQWTQKIFSITDPAALSAFEQEVINLPFTSPHTDP